MQSKPTSWSVSHKAAGEFSCCLVGIFFGKSWLTRFTNFGLIQIKFGGSTQYFSHSLSLVLSLSFFLSFSLWQTLSLSLCLNLKPVCLDSQGKKAMFKILHLPISFNFNLDIIGEFNFVVAILVKQFKLIEAESTKLR